MEYLVFEGKSYREALDQMYAVGAKRNILGQMQIVKKLEEEKKFLFKKNKIYKVIVSVIDRPAIERSRKARAEKWSSGSPSLFGEEYHEDTPTVRKTPTQNSSTRQAYADKSTQTINKENDELRSKVEGLEGYMKDLEGMIKGQLTDMRESLIQNMVSNERNEEKKILQDVEITKQNIKWMEDFLRQRDFSPALVSDIVEYLQTQKKEVLLEKNRIITTTRDFLKRALISEEIVIDNYNHGNMILFAGPTGVGKTITIVKMAAHVAAMRQKSMRFISVDRYKVGADSQLKAYAELMRTPFNPIHKQQDFFDLLEQEGTDFTFIDTAGKGPRETIAIKELAEWIKKSNKKIDVHLVVSAGTKGADLEFMMDKYAPLEYDHILATKLDETVHSGSIISLVYQSKKPLSFITNGQEVPQDFEIANIDKLIADSLK